MLLFAHTGITLATARIVTKLAGRHGSGKYLAPGNCQPVDYFLVLIGSMLPDLIDKPLGGLVMKEALGNGRIYAHTLVFLLILLGVGLYSWRRFKRPEALVLAGGTFMHNLLDGMWLNPATFLWPAYGWAFPKRDAGDWINQWLTGLLTSPDVYVPEIIGGLLLIALFWIPVNSSCNRKGRRHKAENR